MSTYAEQREAYLAAARKRTAARRTQFTKAERDAYLAYLRDYGKRNRAAIYARATLWRYTNKLAHAELKGDERAVIKFRAKLASLNQIIHCAPLW